ncbi:MAG: LacI family transcriptional regulator [Brachybacterium faecium]|nr:MAG: LacI family transcriptional regulator [Brachybacterium faecium]
MSSPPSSTPPRGTSARRATIIDVAARAGVSRQTVTRAVNDMPGISAATRERVLRAAQELHYRPSRFGRGLVEQGPTTLGVVIKDLSNSFFAELGAALVRSSAPHGWNVVLADIDHAPEPERVAVELSRRVDAIVGYGVDIDDIRGAIGMPVVHLDGKPRQAESAGVVQFGAVAAMDDLAGHLELAGVRRPMVLDLATAGAAGPSSRAQGLVAALDRIRGAATPPVVAVDARDGHRDVLEAALADGADALIAFNDELAVRLLHGLRSVGVDVPGRVRVVGVDGLEISGLVTPELTTLAIDIAEIAEQTVALVAGMLEGAVPLHGEHALRTVPYRLLVRDSA